jgi:hypothetical protein
MDATTRYENDIKHVRCIKKTLGNAFGIYANVTHLDDAVRNMEEQKDEYIKNIEVRDSIYYKIRMTNDTPPEVDISDLLQQLNIKQYRDEAFLNELMQIGYNHKCVQLCDYAMTFPWYRPTDSDVFFAAYDYHPHIFERIMKYDPGLTAYYLDSIKIQQKRFSSDDYVHRRLPPAVLTMLEEYSKEWEER